MSNTLNDLNANLTQRNVSNSTDVSINSNNVNADNIALVINNDNNSSDTTTIQQQQQQYDNGKSKHYQSLKLHCKKYNQWYGVLGLLSIVGIILGIVLGLQLLIYNQPNYNYHAVGLKLSYIPNGMVISWQTNQPYRNNATLLYSLYNQTIIQQNTFDVNNTVTARQLYDNGLLNQSNIYFSNNSNITTYDNSSYYYSIILNNLQPNTTYIYQIMYDISNITNNTINGTNIYSFTTSPIVGSYNIGDEIVVVGDVCRYNVFHKHK